MGDNGDKLIGMKEICNYMNGISERTALKWHFECMMPIKKINGQWAASKKVIDKWFEEYKSIVG